MLKIDGIDYTQMSLQDMRRQIGIVLQEPFLFNGTVADQHRLRQAERIFGGDHGGREGRQRA